MTSQETAGGLHWSINGTTKGKENIEAYTYSFRLEKAEMIKVKTDRCDMKWLRFYIKTNKTQRQGDESISPPQPAPPPPPLNSGLEHVPGFCPGGWGTGCRQRFDESLRTTMATSRWETERRTTGAQPRDENTQASPGAPAPGAPRQFTHGLPGNWFTCMTKGYLLTT